jgi:protein-disulfide isomerase
MNILPPSSRAAVPGKHRRFLAGALALTLAGAASLLSLQPASAQQAPFTPEQTQAIQRIIKDYLISNPEIFAEIQQAMEAKAEAEQAERIKTAVKGKAAEIYRSASSPTVGNPSGDVTIVEFFDYNCGYCKTALPALAELLKRDPKVKLVMKEVTFIGRETSAAVSRLALAAKAQGKYWEMHRALLETKGVVNEAVALKAAEKLGLNMDKLKKDAASAEVKKELDDAMALAQNLGVNGTPFFLVGDRSIPGAPQNLLEAMTGLVAEVRKEGGCKVC